MSFVMMSLIQQNKAPEEVNASVSIVKKQFDDDNDDNNDM